MTATVPCAGLACLRRGGPVRMTSPGLAEPRSSGVEHGPGETSPVHPGRREKAGSRDWRSGSAPMRHRHGSTLHDRYRVYRLPGRAPLPGDRAAGCGVADKLACVRPWARSATAPALPWREASAPRWKPIEHGRRRGPRNRWRAMIGSIEDRNDPQSAAFAIGPRWSMQYAVRETTRPSFTM